MDFKIDGKDLELNFGVRFVAALDELETIDANGIKFGMGLMITEPKLEMGSIGALSNVIISALHKHPRATLDKVFDTLDEIVDNDKLEELFDEVDAELKNSNAVRSSKAQMEKNNTETNRKQGLKAVKPTK